MRYLCVTAAHRETLTALEAPSEPLITLVIQKAIKRFDNSNSLYRQVTNLAGSNRHSNSQTQNDVIWPALHTDVGLSYVNVKLLRNLTE